MNKGIFIAIEGIDGTGKGTQHKLLIDKLKSKNFKVASVDFPQDETSLFGKLIAEVLKGSMDDFSKIPPEIISVIYAADRFKASSSIRENLDKGILVVSNRYTLSNAHQAARVPKRKQSNFLKWLLKMEYGKEGFNIPEPDMYIHLHLPVEIAQSLILLKGKRKYLSKKSKDALESDLENQINTAKMYQQVAQTQPNLVSINCAPEGKLLSINEIHDLVWLNVQKLLTRS